MEEDPRGGGVQQEQFSSSKQRNRKLLAGAVWPRSTWRRPQSYGRSSHVYLGAHQVCSSRAFQRCPQVWEPANDFVERSNSVLADRWESQKRAVVTLNVAPSGLESRPREFLATSKLSVCVTGLYRYYLKLSIIIVIGTIYVLSL